MKEVSISFSPAAADDLDRVFAEVFEASKDLPTTRRYLKDFLRKIAEKRTFPESGTPLSYGNLFTGYYFVVFKAYIAFYRIDANRNIFVDRVLHGKSDYCRILGIPSADDR